MDDLKKIMIENNLIAAEDDVFFCFAIPIISYLQTLGATLLIQFDGERSKNGISVILQGGPLGDDFIRSESDDMQLAIKTVICKFFDEIKKTPG